ncbi:cytochrome P450 2A12-like [Dermacentor albipictus]|uniref:cytochrome P450 2A12-like n=1 Tax=Dermacentor albipictus TaxID=60249 RepID=UPI0031FC6B30
MSPSLTQEFLWNVLRWEVSWSAIAVWSTIASVLFGLKSLVSKRRDKKSERLPPGPSGVPLLGYLPFVWKPYHVAFKEMSDHYGPIFRVRLGCRDVVVLNDVASVREGLNNPDIFYRPEDFVFRYLDTKGIGGLNGEIWQVNRRYCFQVLRNLGFAKKPMEKHIQEEIQGFTTLLEFSKAKPVKVAQQLTASVANNMTALLFGERCDPREPRGRLVAELLTMFLQNANFFTFNDFLPVVRFFAVYIPKTRLRIVNYVFTEFKKLVRAEVKNREQIMDQYKDKDFIDGYLRKVQENKGINSHFSLAILEATAINFYSASTNTVRSAILWNLYIAASDPDGHQARIHREIDSAVGKLRAPQWDDRLRMPFTMASILEMLRWRTISPIGINRAAARNTVICGYDVPAGTIVVANFWSLHNDPVNWHCPSKYDPTRFLNADGTEVKEKPIAFLPFSTGKRGCPGETLALMEIFLYLTTVLQKFRVLPEEGKSILLDEFDALLTVIDDTQGLRFILR